MAVVDLDPGLTAAGPAAIAAGLDDRIGEPLLVRLDATALAAGPEAGAAPEPTRQRRSRCGSGPSALASPSDSP